MAFFTSLLYNCLSLLSLQSSPKSNLVFQASSSSMNTQYVEHLIWPSIIRGTLIFWDGLKNMVNVQLVIKKAY